MGRLGARIAAARTGVRDHVARTRRRLPGEAVAMTFDDGPSLTTGAVLDTLATHGVRATFFLVGRNAQRRPALVRRIVAEGHAVGSHSLTHPYPWQLSTRALWCDYRDGRRAVEDVAGAPVRLFRPPHTHLDRRGAVAIRAAGLHTWLWTREAEDWAPEVGSGDIVARLLPLRHGDVALLHDGVEQPVSPAARDRSAMLVGLDAVLTRAVADGVRFTTLAPVADRPGPRPAAAP